MASMLSKCQLRIQRDMDMVRGYYPVHEESPFEHHVFEDHHHLKIVIPTNYPFQCIMLNVVNKDTHEESSYVEVYKRLIGYYYHHLRGDLPSPGHCICCNHIGINWSPHNRMINVIKELVRYHEWWKALRTYYYAKELLTHNNDLNNNINNDTIHYILTFLNVDICF